MSYEVKIREYLPGDEKSLVELLFEVFKGWPHFDLQCTPLEHWRWKYLDNPMKLNAIGVAEANGEIVGCEHGYFVDVKIGNRMVLAYHSGDAAIDSKFQGKGIYSKINDLIHTLPQMSKIDYSFWASTNIKMIEYARRRRRPKFPRRLLQMIRIRDLDLHFQLNKGDGDLLKKIAYRALQTIDRRRGDLTIGSGGYEVKAIKEFDSETDSFWNLIKGNYKYIVVRNREYLNWRFCDHRAGDYHVMQAQNDKGVLGYCVYRINKNNKEYPRGYIMDLIAIPNRADVISGLLSCVLGRIDDLGVNYVSSWAVQGHSYTGILKSLGFFDSRRPLDLYLRWGNMRADELGSESLADELHCQIGDLDW